MQLLKRNAPERNPDKACLTGIRWRACLITALYALCVSLSSCAFLPQDAGRAKGESATESLSDLKLHYEMAGRGKPLLLLHGLGANTHSWRYIVGALAASYQVICLDLKGFGASPKPLDTAYSVYDQAALVRKFILEQDLRNLTLIGHSFGGLVALVTTLSFEPSQRSRLSHLVLISTVASEQRKPPFFRILVTPVLGPLVLKLVPTEWIVKYILKRAYHDDAKIADDTVARYAAPLDSPGAHHALLQTARQLRRLDADELASHYSHVELPALIIWGQQDEIVPLEVGYGLHSAIPHSELAIIPHSGHIPIEEHPRETVAAILNFLNKGELDSRVKSGVARELFACGRSGGG
jgi:pimeloyl-ACP methyl ester carboxylesterase